MAGFYKRTLLGKHIKCPGCGVEKYRPPSYRGGKCCSLKCRDKVVKAKRVRDGEARCAKCRTWKPVTEFVRGQVGRPHSYCKPCNAAYMVPTEKRKRAYRPLGRLTEEDKKQTKREANKRQHLKRRAGGAVPTKYELERVFCWQDCRCAYCNVLLDGEKHIDHKLPVSRGGTNELGNLQFTCPRCNMRKGAMTHEEFLVSKRRPVVRWENGGPNGTSKSSNAG